MTMGGMGVEEISAKNTHKKMKTLHQTLNPRVWVDKRPQYSSRVWTPPSHLCIDHDPLKTSFIPPLQHASENHLLHVKKSLSYWIPVTGTDMLTGRRDDFKTNKQTNKECLARAPELQDGNSKSKHTNAFSCHYHNDNQTTDRV